MAIKTPRKLIEVALPLDEINKAAAREKSIRHGHPSTLHLWWARRPLAAARAVLFAQLVNDPSEWRKSDGKKLSKKDAEVERQKLFTLIGQLVKWENIKNEEILEQARVLIRDSWRQTCELNPGQPGFDPERLPAFHDPFAGGGAIPLEAQRLGLETFATDLNPVAVLINKAMIEIPPKFIGRSPVGPIPSSEKQAKASVTEDWSGVRGLAEDVRRYGTWMREEAFKRIGHLYPKVKITKEIVKARPDLMAYDGQELTVIAWVWARTVKSPNPAFSNVEIPLASSFMLSKKEGKETYVEPVIEGAGYRFLVKVGKPKDPNGALNGTKLTGANFRCLMSNTPVTSDHIKSEAQAGRMGARMMAMVAEGARGRVYLSPTKEMEVLALQSKPKWIPDVEFFQQALGFRVGNYGMTKWSDLFTSRQVLALTTFSDLVQEARDRVRQDAEAAGRSGDATTLAAGGNGANAYADAVAVYLAFAVDKEVESLSTICTWSAAPKNELVVSTFRRQALPMTWDFGEANPFAWSSGSLGKNVEVICECMELALSAASSGSAQQRDAASTESVVGGGASSPVVSTDPPYYDNIGYADLSDFFYVWLRRSLKAVFPEVFATLTVPKLEELVATPARHGGKEKAEGFFLLGMTEAMHRLAEQGHRAFPVTIYYAFKQSETEGDDEGGTSSTGWETFLEAVIRAGFNVCGTWPVRTERASRSRGIESNALASSIVLVCRPGDPKAGEIGRRDFLRELEKELPDALGTMIGGDAGVSPIAPVDLAQAAIGPGMAIYSKYKTVLEADGSPMTVHHALIHINKAIDDYFAHAEGDMDEDTRFCVDWFQECGFSDGVFGQADVLARAKGTSVDAVAKDQVIKSSAGKVRLLKVKEYPDDWDPSDDTRIPIWKACHQMVRALQVSEGEAGKLLAKMPEKQERIRQLAYRLYTLCERKGWAEDARGYNELITSWPAIVEASQNAGTKGEQLTLV